MSKRLFSFLLSELTLVRFRCRHCGAVLEVPIQRLGAAFSTRSYGCAACGAQFRATGQGHPPPTPLSPAHALSNVVADLLADDSRVEIEFVLPDPE